MTTDDSMAREDVLSRLERIEHELVQFRRRILIPPDDVAEPDQRSRISRIIRHTFNPNISCRVFVKSKSGEMIEGQRYIGKTISWDHRVQHYTFGGASTHFEGTCGLLDTVTGNWVSCTFETWAGGNCSPDLAKAYGYRAPIANVTSASFGFRDNWKDGEDNLVWMYAKFYGDVSGWMCNNTNGCAACAP